MPRILSLISTQEKNKLATDSVFLVMLEIQLPYAVGGNVRIVHNTEDVTWKGQVWQKFPFQLGDITENTDGSDPNIPIKVSNEGRGLQYAVEQIKGGNGCPVRIIVINTKDMANAVLDEKFVVTSCICDEHWVTFNLGAEYSARTRRPRDRYFKNACRFQFKSTRCGYSGSDTTCGKTLKECRLKGNSARYGGFPGIDQGGIYAN